MPPPLALALTVLFVFWLLLQESRRAQGTSVALWVPVGWLSIISSRYVSEWFASAPPGSIYDGSPVDQPVFLGLILAAAWILVRRGVPWLRLPAVNPGVTLFLTYGLISILWSDFPFVGFKRWIKVVGHSLMVLVVFTEPDPKEALRALFKRTAYLLIPTSVLLIKYYPEYGRGFSAWTGAAYNTGVTTNKNSLGFLCLFAAFFFIWNLIVYRREMAPAGRKQETVIMAALLGMALWLLNQADSATSLMSLVVGVGAVVALGIRRLREKRLALYLCSGALLCALLESVFGLTEVVIASLGRDATLTDRTELWEDVLAVPVNPLIGVGFESFWLGERLDALWSKWPWQPNQAHSGYLETYLNGGWLGIVFLAVLVVSCYRNAKAKLIVSPPLGRLHMGFLAMILVYNYTEAAFKGLHPLFFVLFLTAWRLPVARTDVEPNRPPPAVRWRQVGATLCGRSGVRRPARRLSPGRVVGAVHAR